MITYDCLDIKQIDIIKPLWAKLSIYHKEVSVFFSKEFDNDKFFMRKEVIQQKENALIFMAYYHKKPVGYLITSVHKNVGEIESLYVDQHYRGSEIGDELMTRALSWIKSFTPETIKVSVAYGNQVIAFYERYGFFPRSVILKEQETMC